MASPSGSSMLIARSSFSHNPGAIMLPRLAILGVMLMSSPAFADVKGPTPFGKTADGTAVDSYTLSNKNGVTVKLMTLGATVTEVNVPDKAGKVANVVLGFDDVAGYQSDKNQY